MPDPSREGGLLAWQLRNYPRAHRDRRNLAVHAATAPLFVAGTLALVAAPFTTAWLLPVAAPALLVPLAVQGRGHRLEAQGPVPFRSGWDLLVRLAVEQWITFPRFVLGGGFSAAWRAAGPPSGAVGPTSAAAPPRGR